jgi:type IV pilus assembly protein PilQ
VVDRPVRTTFSFDNAEITEIIDTIAKLSGANIVIAPEVGGTLTLRLTEVPWRDALEVVAKTLNFVVVEENRGILRVVDPLTLESQLETRSYQLRYIRPPSKYIPKINSEYLASTQTTSAGGSGDFDTIFPVLPALRKALSGNGGLDYIPSKNTIIVRDTAQVHSQIKSILERLDTEPAQIFIDVKFVSTSNSDLFSLGVDYGDLGPSASYGGGQIPITIPFDLGAGGFEDGIIANTGGIGPFADAVSSSSAIQIPDTIFGALSFTQWLGTLRMLQRDTTAEVIQAPKLLALDGREATIFVGETIRYAEAKTEQGQAGGLSLSVKEATNSPVSTGFQLVVIPHVIPGSNKVEMDVIPNETSLTGKGDPTLAPAGFDVFTVGSAGMEGTIALPRERSSTIVTTMLIDSGQTAVIGGLTTESDIETVSQVPFLSHIPLLGWFFEHEERSVDKNSLWIFVTPTIVRTSSDHQRVLERELRLRQDAYGERLHQILYGDDPDAALGHTTVDPASAPAGSGTARAGSRTAPPAVAIDPATAGVGSFASFVQTTDPADQAVIDTIEQSPQKPL